MNKRTFILCASFGTLVLSTVPITAGFSPASFSSDGPSAEQEPQTSQTKGTSKKRSGLLNAAYGSAISPSEAPASPVDVDESTLWLARAIYSETKLPHEQELVAWVIRNRVETKYRGASTYREVILDPYQFSAFNPGSTKRSFYANLTPETKLAGWQQALWVAYYVRHAEPVYRPFSIKTRHFYSEQSMTGRRSPYWADGSQFVSPGWNYMVDERRFRFYEQIS